MAGASDLYPVRCAGRVAEVTPAPAAEDVDRGAARGAVRAAAAITGQIGGIFLVTSGASRAVYPAHSGVREVSQGSGGTVQDIERGPLAWLVSRVEPWEVVAGDLCQQSGGALIGPALRVRMRWGVEAVRQGGHRRKRGAIHGYDHFRIGDFSMRERAAAAGRLAAVRGRALGGYDP